jgi:hypothetical protein
VYLSGIVIVIAGVVLLLKKPSTAAVVRSPASHRITPLLLFYGSYLSKFVIKQHR